MSTEKDHDELTPEENAVLNSMLAELFNFGAKPEPEPEPPAEEGSAGVLGDVVQDIAAIALGVRRSALDAGVAATTADLLLVHTFQRLLDGTIGHRHG